MNLFFAVLTSFSAFGSVQDLSQHPKIAGVTGNLDYALKFSPSVTGQSGGTPVTYRPSTGYMSGYEVSYEGINIGFINVFEPNAEKKRLNGKTELTDYRVAFDFGNDSRYLLRTSVGVYRGLYVSNSKEIDTSLADTDPQIQRPDLEIINQSAEFIYTFAPQDFSLPAVLFQSARQTSSGGSWLLGTSYEILSIKGDTDLIPATVQNYYGPDAKLLSGNFATLSVFFGGGYTLAWESLYATVVVAAGPGRQVRKYKVDQVSYESDTTTSKMFWLASTGFNGEHFFLGATFTNGSNNYSAGTVRIDSALFDSKFFVGVRF